MKRLALLLLVVLVCAGNAPGGRVHALSGKPGPTRTQDFDLDLDGTVEHFVLQGGSVSVSAARLEIWRSPGEWQVDDFLLGDVTGDGVPDLVLPVWKEGSFGRDKPLWAAGDDRSVKNHLFVFNLVGCSMKPVWQSSNLDRPNLELALEDCDGDGSLELVALEGDYGDPAVRRTTVWRWNGWGFSMVSARP